MQRRAALQSTKMAPDGQQWCLQNPETANPPNAGLGKNQKADYTEDKKKEFEGSPGGYSWISAKDTSLLDFEGCEMVLIAVKTDISGAAHLSPTLLQHQHIPDKRQISIITWYHVDIIL